MRPLQERTGTPTGFTLTLDYQGLRGETVATYQEDGRDPIEIASWKGNSGGFSYREAHFALELVAEAGLVGSLEVVEVNPILDRENATGRLAVELVASALGARIL